MPSAKITSKGQVTIPKSIRKALKVEAGDRLDFVVEAGGRVVVRPGAGDIAALKGLLYQAGRRPVTVDEMNAAVERLAQSRR